MNSNRNIAVALVSVGVFIVAARYLVDVGETVALAMSLGGAAIVLLGALLLWRGKRPE